MIAAATEAGGEVVWSAHANDDEATLERAMRDAIAVADVLITSGGVSMGTRDLIKPLFAGLGEIHFGRIAFKPGKPLTFAIGPEAGRPGVPVRVAGLPGLVAGDLRGVRAAGAAPAPGA